LSKAQAIVDYREAYGLFSRADEIVFVRGIGDSTYENNKSDILVE
jgi:competence ComEA-like helix-hairpin-helix protein